LLSNEAGNIEKRLPHKDAIASSDITEAPCVLECRHEARHNFKYVLNVAIIYLNTTAKACSRLRRDRIFGADGDGASPVSTKRFTF